MRPRWRFRFKPDRNGVCEDCGEEGEVDKDGLCAPCAEQTAYDQYADEIYHRRKDEGLI